MIVEGAHSVVVMEVELAAVVEETVEEGEGAVEAAKQPAWRSDINTARL